MANNLHDLKVNTLFRFYKKGNMIDAKKSKRLVLIGIRKKGDSGFKKHIDAKYKGSTEDLAPKLLPLSRLSTEEAIESVGA